MQKDLPVRKKIRLEGYDYSRVGSYFVTFCVQDRHDMLGQIVGSGFHARPQTDVVLSELGEEVQKTIEYISSNNKNVKIHKYVIMPNHVHMIIGLSVIENIGETSVGHGNPTLQSVVGQIKSYTAKRWSDMCNEKYQTFWQERFYDHIIRDEADYQRICKYIDENPAKWLEDEYYK